MILSRTPLRICLTGGGTDVRDFYAREYGAVITCTISRYIYVAVSRRFTEELRVATQEIEHGSFPSEVKHPLVRESLLRVLGETATGLDILTASEVPAEGTGLGSSSALTVGLLNALYEGSGRHVSPADLAAGACEIEIERLGGLIGKLDQYAVSLGGLRYTRFNRDETVDSHEIPISPAGLLQLEAGMMLFYTGKKVSSSVVMGEQQKRLDINMPALLTLRDQSDSLLARLVEGDIDATGAILHEAWMRKRTLSGSVTNPLIDGLYDAALRAGALGGKITGAGGGGFLLLYCRPENQPEVRRALAGFPELTFKLDPLGSRINVADSPIRVDSGCSCK
jgi:D-glycero-alpha-D-manno-heptose-7-phosphate kinase